MGATLISSSSSSVPRARCRASAETIQYKYIKLIVWKLQSRRCLFKNVLSGEFIIFLRGPFIFVNIE